MLTPGQQGSYLAQDDGIPPPAPGGDAFDGRPSVEAAFNAAVHDGPETRR
jgi:hypothetical protein